MPHDPSAPAPQAPPLHGGQPSAGGHHADEFPPERITVSRRAAWALILAFLLLLGVPPLVQEVREWSRGAAGWVPARELVKAVSGSATPDKPIAARLRGFENGLARLEFTDGPRRAAQQFASGWLDRGNDRTVRGREGWLFFRPELAALTGYGPLEPEPHSVSRDPSLLEWQPPLEPIRKFAAGLRARGVALWLVPVPMKPSVYPEMLDGGARPEIVRHRDATAFYSALRDAGVEVLDLGPALMAAKAADAAEGPVYLRHDTHWSPRGMAAGAAEVARRLRQDPAVAALPPVPFPAQAAPAWSRPDFGDLVRKLDPADPAALFTPQTVPLLRVLDPATAEPLPPDGDSPLVVLGDSFVNVFDDPSLGFAPAGLADGARIGAGFAQHLSWQLQRPLDVHAVNGEGASGVRTWLARRGESAVQAKKIILWVIAERDLMLSRTQARQNQVEWATVDIAPDPAKSGTPPAEGAGPLVVEATLLEKSEQPDPRRANYPDSLYVVKYRVKRTLIGSGAPETILVVHWNFRTRKVQPDAGLEEGQDYQLTLEPWDDHRDLQLLNLSDDFDATDARWFAVKAEEAGR